jgi:regulator of sigma E protease
MNIFQNLLGIIPYIFWFIAVMIPLVTIHEFGHFIFARLFKVKVPEFGVGVPPKAVGKRWKGLTWSLNWIPLGAFVRIQGDNDSIETAYRNIQNGTEDKAKYIEERTNEVLQLKDLADILEKNNVVYDDKWQVFENKFNNKEYILTEDYKSKMSQLQTFINWEYDSYFKSKNIQAFNTLFFTKNLIQKILILVGGVTFNILGAYLIFLIALNSTGLLARNTFENNGAIDFNYLAQDKIVSGIKGTSFSPDTRQLNISGDSKNPTPAYDAKIPTNAVLVSINNMAANTLDNTKLVKFVRDNPDKEFEIIYKDKEGEATKRAIITPKIIADAPRLGINLTNSMTYKSKNFVSSIGDAATHTVYYTQLTTKLTLQFFADLVNPARYQKAVQQTSGPVMISYVSKTLFDDWGLSAVLWLMALVSISLAVFNLLPIPALDGGRIVLVVLERIFGSRVKKFEPILVTSTYFLLLAAMFLILGKDVNEIWKISQRG